MQDPMSGLTSSRMRKILEEAAARFDWVIIDTARWACSPTPASSAGMVDGALLVVRAGQTPHGALTKAVERPDPREDHRRRAERHRASDVGSELSKYYSGGHPRRVG